MNVLDAIQNRTSIRAFKPDPVPMETIQKILEISQRSPSAISMVINGTGIVSSPPSLAIL